eukprot:1359004-Prymnesium_polylepis.1
MQRVHRWGRLWAGTPYVHPTQRQQPSRDAAREDVHCNEESHNGGSLTQRPVGFHTKHDWTPSERSGALAERKPAVGFAPLAAGHYWEQRRHFIRRLRWPPAVGICEHWHQLHDEAQLCREPCVGH